MRDLPAPHHSAALNRMLNLPPVHPDLEPPLLRPGSIERFRARRAALRRAGAARARERRASRAA